jgi:hypothetical protein
VSLPPECQPIADQISSLVAQEEAARAALAGLSGVDKWKKMLDLGTIRQQIADQQASLIECEKQHAADLTTEVVIFDLPGDSGPNRIGRVWQLTSDGQAVKQTVTIQNGSANFIGIVGSARQSFGITIESTDHPTANGPDFRSGPLPVALAPNNPDPVSRIEIVILDPIKITADSLNQAAPALPIQLTFPAGPVGNIHVSVTNLSVVMSSGNISLTATGTASGLSFPFTTSSPLAYTSTLHIAPTFDMAPSVIVEALTGTTPVLSIPGLIGDFVQTITPLLSSSLLDRAVKPIVSFLNTEIAKRVVAALGLSALPSGSVLSIRELTADNDTLTVTPVLGAFGTVLSAFQPAAPASVVNLASLDVQPALIGTGDSANVAQGTVSLDVAAPAGGVTVQLSCDRTDLMSIDPSVMVIREGQTAGSFTVTASGQPLMSATNVDGTVRASLGARTLTAPLSIRPEQPATIVPPPATPAPTPFTGDLEVASITLLTPSPLPLRQPISGQITLNGLASMAAVTGVIVYDPAVLPPQGFIIPVGSFTSYFQFTLGPNFPGNTLRVTAMADKGGARKSIDVAVGV